MMKNSARWRIHIRYVVSLLWEFRAALVVFWSLVAVGGLILHAAYPGRPLSYAEACYAVFLLIFLESYLDFPAVWYLQPLFFLLPVVGLGAVADSLVRLAYLVFARKNRLPEWQAMVASSYRDHVVVVGVGKVGFQIIKGLTAMGEPVVAVERPAADSPLVEELLDLDVPIIRGDGRTAKTLRQAGAPAARAVVLATSDDLTNLDAALEARDLSPRARIVLRLFDESLAAKVRGAFAMPAISTSQVSASAFIAAATGRHVYQHFQLAGRSLFLVDLAVVADGGLVGRTVGDIQVGLQVNVVMHSGPAGVSINPGHDIVLTPGDELLAVAPLEKLTTLEALNQNRQGGSRQ